MHTELQHLHHNALSALNLAGGGPAMALCMNMNCFSERVQQQSDWICFSMKIFLSTPLFDIERQSKLHQNQIISPNRGLYPTEGVQPNRHLAVSKI